MCFTDADDTAFKSASGTCMCRACKLRRTEQLTVLAVHRNSEISFVSSPRPLPVTPIQSLLGGQIEAPDHGVSSLLVTLLNLVWVRSSECDTDANFPCHRFSRELRFPDQERYEAKPARPSRAEILFD
jgi:hypothetical protein